jgi:hypothetical protein
VDGEGINASAETSGDCLTMLWKHYVFRRGPEVHDLWDHLFEDRPIRLLYIAGRGFDVRAQRVMKAFVDSVELSGYTIATAELLLVGFTGYLLSQELHDQTERNARMLEDMFRPFGGTAGVRMGTSAAGEDDISATTALRLGTEAVLEKVKDHTDIILDVSSLPRVVYLALMTGLLHRLIPEKRAADPLVARHVNFQVLVAEDAALDARIRSEDPINDLVYIPGFSSALHAESVQDWPVVWFPILGENRVGQLQKVLGAIPTDAEICPVLPHPSRDPRRPDRLLVEYKEPLFDSGRTPTANILYVHESHPFEVYRQLLRAMQRYRESMQIIGGCRLVVTPLASKLITLGAGLACFEMRPAGLSESYGVAIPYAEPRRYLASTEDLCASTPEISALVLTGDAYTAQ